MSNSGPGIPSVIVVANATSTNRFDITDEIAARRKERHEEIRALVETKAFGEIQEKLTAEIARATQNTLRAAESGDASGAAFQAGRVNALQFALELPRRLLSES